MSQSLDENRGDAEDPQGPGAASESETQNLSPSVSLDSDTQILTEEDSTAVGYTPRVGRVASKAAGASKEALSRGRRFRGNGRAKGVLVTEKADEPGSLPPKIVKRRRALVRFMLLAFGIAAIAFAYTYASQQRKAARDDAAPVVPSTSSSEQTVKKGELIRRGVFEATLVDVRGNFVPENPTEHPEPGQKFVAVEFRLTNKEDQAVVLSTKNQFDLKSGKQRFEVSPVATPVPPFPQTMTLAPGQTIQGWLSFKVPAQLKKLQLVFNARVPRI